MTICQEIVAMLSKTFTTTYYSWIEREGILTPNFSSVFMSVVFIGSKTRCTSPRKSHVLYIRKEKHKTFIIKHLMF